MATVSQTLEQAVHHHQAGNLQRAELLYRQILQTEPHHPQALQMLGVIALQVGQYDRAVELIGQSLRLRPNFAEAHNNLGMVLAAQGKLAQAAASYRQAIQLQPNYPDAHNNLGNALKDQANYDQAIASYQDALRYRSNFAEAYNNLGNALQLLNRLDEAIAVFQVALRIKPDLAEAHNNWANTLSTQGKLDEAVARYRQALRCKPDAPQFHDNLANALKAQGKASEALAAYQEALRLHPGHANTHNGIGNLLKDQARLTEGIAEFRTALALQPHSSQFHDNLIFTLHYHPDYDADALYQEARRWNANHAEPLAQFQRPHANNPDPHRRLRIGYVSPDFRVHAVAHFILPLLANHDRRQVEVFCYADVPCPDDMTGRLRGHADVWRPTVALGDEQMTALVRQDRIDILVDLALHTANNRLPVFARKPAPVQVTWLGYPGTTGLSAIDYRLTDPYLDPPGTDAGCYAEESICLPASFWCFDPGTDDVPVATLPANRHGFVTFGCLNNFTKVNDGVLALWARLLQVLPDARLLLLAPGPVRDHVWRMFAQAQIAAERVLLVDQRPKKEYLQLHNQIDIGLDPTPFNGGTTSLHALWMGVPLVTLVGRTAVGRAGWSLLSNLGLPELAAQTPEEYVTIAADLACDLPRLQQLRAGLRERLRASPLMDAPRFARNIEHAFRQMWQKWCARPSPYLSTVDR